MVQFCRAAEPGSGRVSDSMSESCLECGGVNDAALETLGRGTVSLCRRLSRLFGWINLI